MGRVVIWDLPGEPPPSDGTHVLWREFGPLSRSSDVSIPELVERHADVLRARYLSWVHDLGQTKIRGRCLVDHLRIRPGFSYWWSSTVAQNPNFYDAPWIVDAIKCLALDRFVLADHREGEVELWTASGGLREVLSAWCRSRRVPFRSPPVAGPQAHPSSEQGTTRFTRIRSTIATALQALRVSPQPGEKHQALTRDGICFFDIFVYLTAESLLTGRFGSHYWAGLTEAQHEVRRAVHWVHVFYPHPEVPTLDDAAAVVAEFNASAEGRSTHLLLERASGRSALWRGGRDYLRLLVASWSLRPDNRACSPDGTDLDFWPLLESSWLRAFRGPRVLRDCVRLAQFEQLCRAMPHQAMGVFIQENQPWELALIYAWRQAGHGTLVGAPHSTLRFWDLRYFRDPRVYGDPSPSAMPTPDVVAVNGPMAHSALRDSGFPADKLVEVEALRFSHLHEVAAESSTSTHASTGPLRILICGDNIPNSNERLLAAVGEAAGLVPADTYWMFKPHKAKPCDPSVLAGVVIPVVERPIADLLAECDLVVTGNVTSAAADAYCRGIRVAVLRDGTTLNGSPVRGLSHVGYFSDGAELAGVVVDPAAVTPPGEGLFTLDPALPRWRSLLGWKQPS